MLLNGVHLLPDVSGALVWPGRQVLAIADPIRPEDGRAAAALASQVVRQVVALCRHRRPRTIVWLGSALRSLMPTLPAREKRELDRALAAHEWIWVEDEISLAPLTFRLTATAPAKAGEVIALPSPLARCDGAVWPAFIIDGQRLLLPAFGPRPIGTEVLSPAFRPLFRRPFQALMLADGRIVTRPRGRLESPP